MRRHIILLVCSLAFASAPLHADTTIHKWVDSQGITHFGSEPPKNTKSVEVEPRVYAPSTPVVPADKATESKVEDKPKDPAEAKPNTMLTISAESIAAQCKNAQQRLQQLEASPRLMTRSEDGQMQRVPEEDRQKMMDEERKRIQEYCE